jgi:AcrR family transcriptional regulator
MPTRAPRKSAAAKPAEARSARKPAPPRKRAPGRPAGDGANLRTRLLDAAIACFARHGIAATSLRAIAVEAGVTPAMLHYYFGDKPQLQQAVIAERLLPATARLRETLAAAGDDIAALVAAFVRGIGEVVARHPWLPSLWVREVLCEGGALRELMLQKIAPQVPQMMAKRFAAAQRKGELNPDLDPRLLMVSLVGLTMFPAASAPIWRRLFATDPAGGPISAIDAETMRRHTLALLDRGIGVG